MKLLLNVLMDICNLFILGVIWIVIVPQVKGTEQLFFIVIAGIVSITTIIVCVMVNMGYPK